MNLLRGILLLIFFITPIKANTIYNIIKIPNLEIYEINTKNKLKYFYAARPLDWVYKKILFAQIQIRKI